MSDDNGAGVRAWVPAPVGAPEPSHRHKRFGDPSRTWTYLDEELQILGFVHRYDPPYPHPDEGDNQKKQIVPQTWDGKRWRFVGWDKPRPLYNLDGLDLSPDAWVVIPEGEKAADAAGELLPGCVKTTASGGTGAFRHADWSPLYTRKKFILWPDNDPQGIALMQEVAAHLCEHCPPGAVVRIVDPTGQAKGWDAADALDEGMTAATVKAWSKSRTKEYTGPRKSPWDEQPRLPPAEPAQAESPIILPYDLFSKPLLPELKHDHLPRALRDYVFDQSEIIGSDPGILAIASLVTVSGAAHDGIKLQARRHDIGWKESARLWGAWIADPSSKKSPAASRGFAPARDIDYRLGKAAEGEREKYRIDKAIHKECENKFIKAKAKALMDRGAAGSAPPAPIEPPNRRLVADDTTIEALGLLARDNPRGLVMLHDELTGWFGAMDAYRSGGTGGKDRAAWLESFNGGSKRIDRIGRESILIPNWSISIMGGVQPSAMRALAAKLPEDGLLQRFMVVMAQERDDNGVDRLGDLAAEKRYAAMLETLMEGVPTPRDAPLRMSEDAIAVRETMETELKGVRRMSTLSPRVKAHLGKWDGLFVRLCLTYHLADAADRRIPPPPLVTGKTAHAVADFMREYLVGHMISFYTDLLDDGSHLEHARWIAGHILANELYVIENRTLTQNYARWRGLPDWTRAATMHALEDAGWLYPVVGENVGKRITRWEVNAHVFEIFHAQAAAERLRRTDQRDATMRMALARAIAKTSSRS